MKSDVLTFAHRGGMAHRRENTLAAFLNARSLGAGAVETDAWLTRDGVVVLDHDGHVAVDGVRRAIADLDRNQLPPHIPTLAEYYAVVGTSMAVAIDVKDSRAAPEIVRVARAAGAQALANLWLVSTMGRVSSWRRLDPTIHLAASWEPSFGNPRPLIARMPTAGVEAINVRVIHAHPSLASACRRSGIRLFLWDVHDSRRARRALALGATGMHGNDIGVMQRAVAEHRERGVA